MRKRTLARECALKILYKIEVGRDSVQDSFDDFWSRQEAADDVRKFTEEIVKGACENIARIDEIISKYAENWEIKRIAIIDKNIMRLGIFELLYMDSIPEKVSINEAIDLAKKYGDVDSGKFVNGILDKVRKEECKK
jgi:N utilization substance protein B